jgi:nucleoside-diphosphate-sugar epimerase
MKILFTGGSSFTGTWFIKELAAAGHAVTAIFRKPAEQYEDDLRRQRVALSSRLCRAVHGCAFGDASFVRLVEEGGWDLLCHHAADVTNYKSPDFDAIRAVGNNTHALQAVLRSLTSSGCTKVVLTGSFFEGGEGAGSQGLPDFSAYGLSKALTAQVFRYYCAQAGVALGKFVIPNPFGPHEEPRFTTYLVKTWLAGGTPACSSPAYVRDNIHVSLLAKAYARFAESLASVRAPSFMKFNPSGYAETQGAFTLRLALEMRPRLNLPCPVELKRQTDFPEPRVRINTDVLAHEELGWDESAAWDDYARYYQQTGGR